MAAQKSTASSVSRKTKAAPLLPVVVSTPNRIEAIPVWVCIGPDGDDAIYMSEREAKVYCKTRNTFEPGYKAEKRHATITSRTVKPISSDNPFAIITSAGIVATTATLDEALEKRKGVEKGLIARFLCGAITTKEESDAELKAWKREIIRTTNPLAAKMASKYQTALDVVADLLGNKIELREPSGRSYAGMSQGMRRATDRECSLAQMDTVEQMTIDVTRDIAAQVVDKLTAYAKRLQAAAERVKAAQKAGKIPRPSVRRGKAVPA